MFSLFEKVIISLFCFLLSISVDAQKLNLNVHVVDARNGESLPYVNVYALTSNKGTISNHEGKFAIAADSDEMIRIGFVGYEMVNLKASQMPKTVRLVPCNILLDEVQVTANEYILLQVSKDLKAQLKKHASKKCQFFMRMLTTCMNKEQTEVFATANSVGNINNLSIVTGNHSRKMNEGENPMISYMTLHRYFELGPWAERTTLRRKPICPLKPDLTIEYLQKHYNIRNEVFEDKDGNRYRRLTLQRLPSVTAPILTGELYLDATTNKMLRFLGQLENSEISFDLVNVFNFAPSKCKIHINYKNSKKGVTEISNVAVQVSSGDIHSQGIMFNIDDMKLNLKSSNLEFETSNDIVSTVRNVGYNQKLWNTTNIVKRTDEEERLMNSPNQNTIANNIPLLDIRFSKDEWNEIYHLDSRADNRLKDMVSRLARFTRSFPQEKVYLHMDNTNYFIGDTIWYAAYTRTTSNNHPSALSGTLYVELYNQDGYMMERQTIEMRNGRGWGNFALKKDYYGGFYELRAYTRWQLNWGLHERDDKALGTDFFCDEKLRSNYYRDYDKLYSRVFPVYDAVANVDTPTQKKMTLRALQHEMPEEHRTPSLALYPEGGNLVDGVPCRVAYEALWSDGEQMQLADRPSRGTIEVTPELGKEQVITFSDVNNNEVKAVLPQPVSKGVALRAQQTDASWNFHLVLSPSLCKDSIAVTIMHQGMLEKAYSIGGTKCSIRVGKAELQEGVNQITVFDVNGCVLADRLFFNTVDQRFKRISVTQNAQSASPQENVESISFKPYSPIKLIVTSEPKSIISMAVHDAAACDEIADNATLRAEMLLSSEVKGFIPNPNYYWCPLS